MSSNFLTGVVPPQPPRAEPQVKASVSGRRVLQSGVVIVSTSEIVTLSIEDLVFDIRFLDDGGEHSFATRNISPKSVEITLKNFSNALGTSITAVEIGTINDEALELAMYVEDVSGKQKVLCYTLTLGRRRGK